jgi:DNA sulfur modification protein DndC
MKIKPTNRFVMDKVTEFGEVVVVLGVRKAESFTREQVINLHKITGSRLSRHSMLPGAYVYTPIEDFTVKDVWDYLFLETNPWGEDNMSLRELYNSADGECPMVIDTLTPSCGNTRFGCWVCTVVDKDKSMEAMIGSGDDWMTPMLEYRNLLARTQNPDFKAGTRSLVRRDGKVWKKDVEYQEGEVTVKGKKLIYGPFDFREEPIRQKLLRRLLQTQQEVRRLKNDPEFKLIQDEELYAIRRIWRAEEGDWEDVLPRIYREETGETLNWIEDDASVFGVLEENLLLEVCQARGVSSELIKQLITTEQSFYGMRRRHQIFQKIDQIFKRDWRDKATILADLASENIVNHPEIAPETTEALEI